MKTLGKVTIFENPKEIAYPEHTARLVVHLEYLSTITVHLPVAASGQAGNASSDYDYRFLFHFTYLLY
jgi:hypothetical protein